MPPGKLLTKQHHWIERRYYSDTKALFRYKWNRALSGLLRRASIETGQATLMASSSKGQRKRGWYSLSPYPRLMRPRFLDPLFPFGEISSNRTYPRLEYRSSRECVCLSMTTSKSFNLPTQSKLSLVAGICHAKISSGLKLEKSGFNFDEVSTSEVYC